jgi:hypothetical protein
MLVIYYTKELGANVTDDFFSMVNQNIPFHREDGPAVEFADGEKHWFINGERHREDGPACELASGDKIWILGNRRFLRKKEFLKHLREVKSMPLVLRLIDPQRWIRELV